MNRKFSGMYGVIGMGMLIFCLLAPAQTASAECPPHSEPYKEDELTVHCRCVKGYVKFEGACEDEKVVWGKIGRKTKTFSARSAELVAALNEVSGKHAYWLPGEKEKAPLPKGKPVDRELLHKNCQTFFRELGEELERRKIESWKEDFPAKDLGKPQADGIVAAIEKEAGNLEGSKKWKKLDNWIEAQNMANQGAIVIGGLRAHGGSNGHLAVVVPMPPDTDLLAFGSQNDSGPLVRDGNEHSYNQGENLSLSTWGAVRASRAMPVQETLWYLWVPSTPSSTE